MGASCFQCLRAVTTLAKLGDSRLASRLDIEAIVRVQHDVSAIRKLELEDVVGGRVPLEAAVAGHNAQI